MKSTVAIIAPFKGEEIETRGKESPFRLLLKNGRAELTLKAIYSLVSASYDVGKVSGGASEFPIQDEIPAGGYYLTGLLRAHGYNTVLTSRFDVAAIKDIAKSNPIAVCISSTLIYRREVLKTIVDRVLAVMPGVTIIVGGAYIWKSYRWACLLEENSKVAHNEYFDVQDTAFNDYIFPCRKTELAVDVFVVSPHGGGILLRIIDELEKGKREFSGIPNVAISDRNGVFYFTERVDEGVDYNNDYTRWDLVDQLPLAVPVTSSFGCPFQCGFCDFRSFYSRILFRSKESLSEELGMLKKLLPSNPQTRYIGFTDDNVFITPQRVTEVCDTLIDSKLNILWWGLIRAASVNTENIKLIKKSGLVSASIGVESGDQGQLDRMKKSTDIKELKTGIELLDKIGTRVNMSFVVGYPGETEETICNTARFLNDLSVNLANFVTFPLELSPLSPVALPENRSKYHLYGMGRQWSHDTMDYNKAVDSCFELFKGVHAVSYGYANENVAFNIRYIGPKLKKINQLRNQITVQVIQGEPWDKIAENFALISETMGLGKKYPDTGLRDEIINSR